MGNVNVSNLTMDYVNQINIKEQKSIKNAILVLVIHAMDDRNLLIQLNQCQWASESESKQFYILVLFLSILVFGLNF